jgi:hypothetical protein
MRLGSEALDFVRNVAASLSSSISERALSRASGPLSDALS